MGKQSNRKKVSKESTTEEGIMPISPKITWTKNAVSYWVPVVLVANISIPLKPRSFRGFHQHERRAIMTFIEMALSEVLFGAASIIANQSGTKLMHSPDFDLLPFYAVDKDGKATMINLEQPDSVQDIEPTKEIVIP